MAEREVSVHEGQSTPQEALAVRERVFVDEQGVPPNLEYDDLGSEAIHAVARVDDEAVGTARLRTLEDATGRIERVAVLAPHRGRGIGRQLMETLEGVARADGIDRIVIHAQVTAEPFYHSIGYETESDVFQEAGMDHVEMAKRLDD